MSLCPGGFTQGMHVREEEGEERIESESSQDASERNLPMVLN